MKAILCLLLFLMCVIIIGMPIYLIVKLMQGKAKDKVLPCVVIEISAVIALYLLAYFLTALI